MDKDCIDLLKSNPKFIHGIVQIIGGTNDEETE